MSPVRESLSDVGGASQRLARALAQNAKRCPIWIAPVTPTSRRSTETPSMAKRQRGGGRVAGCQRADANVRRRVPHSARAVRPLPSRSSTTSLSALLSAAALTSFHHHAPTRTSRPLSSRSSTTPLPALHAAAVRAFFSHLALPSPRSAAVRAFLHAVALPRSSRPRSVRSSAAPWGWRSRHPFATPRHPVFATPRGKSPVISGAVLLAHRPHWACACRAPRTSGWLPC